MDLFSAPLPDPRPLSWRLADPAVALRPPCGSISRMGCFFVMVGIILTSPKWVSQEVVHRPTGKPMDNAQIESFNARQHAECLNAHTFESRDDAEKTLASWGSD